MKKEMTAHEAWIRTHVNEYYRDDRNGGYDPTDDGPETIHWYMAWVSHVLDQVALADVIDYALSTDEYPPAHKYVASWLDTHSHQFDREHDIWDHPRE